MVEAIVPSLLFSYNIRWSVSDDSLLSDDIPVFLIDYVQQNALTTSMPS